MKTLVTGATGFIGSRLAHRLLDEGHETLLLGLKRNEVEAQYLAELEAKGARTVIGSVTEPESLVPAVDGVEVVYHLAAAQHEANVPDQLFHIAILQQCGYLPNLHGLGSFAKHLQPETGKIIGLLFRQLRLLRGHLHQLRYQQRFLRERR